VKPFPLASSKVCLEPFLGQFLPRKSYVILRIRKESVVLVLNLMIKTCTLNLPSIARRTISRFNAFVGKNIQLEKSTTQWSPTNNLNREYYHFYNYIDSFQVCFTFSILACTFVYLWLPFCTANTCSRTFYWNYIKKLMNLWPIKVHLLYMLHIWSV
jgi:hypothetical protein